MFKRRRRRTRPGLVVGAFFVALAALLIMLDLSLRGAFYAIAEVKAVQMATNVIQETLEKQVLEQNISYQDFIVIHTDSEGRITLMQADTVRVNRFAAATTLAVEKTLENLRRQSFSIPLGQVLRLPLLANYGPNITYRIMPVGMVRVNVLDRFESAGINQTRHSIYLAFDTSIRIVVPSKSGETAITNQVPLVESIIVGNVPNTFVNVTGGLFGSGLLR
jgi:sporulation protein YunB